MKKPTNTAKIERELTDLGTMLAVLPDNPIDWVTVVKLVGPVIARLAVRFALKKTRRSLSEDKVTAIGGQVGDFIAKIIENRTTGTP